MVKAIAPNGNGQFIVELGLPVGGKIIPLTGSLVDHTQTKAIEETGVWPVHSHLVTAKDMGVLDKTFRDLTLSGLPKISVRLGFSTGESSVFLPWQTHVVGWYNATPGGVSSQSGPVVKIETRGMLHTLNIEPRVRSRKGKISDIVTEIAGAHGLGAVVEPTGYDGLWSQSFETDYAFIVRLMKRTTSSSGRGGYRLFVQDDALHFHTPEYQADMALVDYFGPGAVRATFVDNSQRRKGLGVAGCSMTAADPKSGLTQLLKQNSELSVRLADACPVFNQNTGLRGLSHVGQNQIAEAQAQAQAAFDTQRWGAFEVLMSTERAMLLRLNDLVNLRVAYGEAKVSTWSGYYSVTKVEYTLDRGALSNMFTLQRGELTGGGGAEIGQKFNLEEVQSSNLTRGVGGPVGTPARMVSVQPAG